MTGDNGEVYQPDVLRLGLASLSTQLVHTSELAAIVRVCNVQTPRLPANLVYIQP